jgi:hypothetical protein
MSDRTLSTRSVFRQRENAGQGMQHFLEEFYAQRQ